MWSSQRGCLPAAAVSKPPSKRAPAPLVLSGASSSGRRAQTEAQASPLAKGPFTQTSSTSQPWVAHRSLCQHWVVAKQGWGAGGAGPSWLRGAGAGAGTPAGSCAAAAQGAVVL